MERLPPGFWQERGWRACVLWPLSTLYRALAALHRRRGRRAARRAPPFGVPVVVVGNLTVGGSGKTPLVLWLAQELRAAGRRPGIVCRGYGGTLGNGSPRRVDAGADAAVVGDEALLLAARSGCPVVAGAERAAAVRLLLASASVDVVLSDDGLQHYRMARDLEIVVIDGARAFGNGLCLPAGPLREPPSRLAAADFCIVHGPATAAVPAAAPPHTGHFVLRAEALVNLAEPARRLAPGAFDGKRVHAVAAVGYPQRFFEALATLGMEVVAHPFPDHHAYHERELCFDDDAPLIMTEKDAVKCKAFAVPHWWYLEVSAVPGRACAEAIMQAIQSLR